MLANRIMPERSLQEPKLGHDSSMDALLAGGLKIEVLGHAPWPPVLWMVTGGCRLQGEPPAVSSRATPAGTMTRPYISRSTSTSPMRMRWFSGEASAMTING